MSTTRVLDAGRFASNAPEQNRSDNGTFIADLRSSNDVSYEVAPRGTVLG
jgi:hypothetical protein